MEVFVGEAAAELLTAAVFGGLIWVHAEMVWLASQLNGKCGAINTLWWCVADQGCVLAIIWRCDKHHDTGVMIQYCDILQ